MSKSNFTRRGVLKTGAYAGAAGLATPIIFDGSVWAGAQGIETGLIDGVGHLVPHMKEVYGDKVAFRVYQQRRPLLSRFGASLVGDALSEIEDRAAFARYGV